jgi:hypothetical protein
MTLALLKRLKRMLQMPLAKVKKQPALRRHWGIWVITNYWKWSVAAVRVWFTGLIRKASTAQWHSR